MKSAMSEYSLRKKQTLQSGQGIKYDKYKITKNVFITILLKQIGLRVVEFYMLLIFLIKVINRNFNSCSNIILIIVNYIVFTCITFELLYVILFSI